MLLLQHIGAVAYTTRVGARWPRATAAWGSLADSALSSTRYNPRKVKGIEVTHARRFLSYSIDQPHMLLHELAHGFHGRVLGWDNAYVRQCYDVRCRQHSAATAAR